jgi:hypothetical protein
MVPEVEEEATMMLPPMMLLASILNSREPSTMK